MALANLPGEWPLIDDRVAENSEAYGQMKAAYIRTDAARDRLYSRYADVFKDCPLVSLLVLRDLARKAWTAPDVRSADWYLFRLRHLHWETVRRVRAVQDAAKSSAKTDRELPTIPGTFDEAMRAVSQSEPPPVTKFEAAAFYLQKNLRRALYCPNAECPAPYFFAKKKGQKFCSPECALLAQRESKRRWWNQNRAKSKGRS